MDNINKLLNELIDNQAEKLRNINTKLQVSRDCIDRGCMAYDSRVDEGTACCETELAALVKEFFEYLDYQEESDSGTLFNPIYIFCCRVMKVEPLDKLLHRMRTLSGAKPNPLSEDALDRMADNARQLGLDY